MALRTATKLHWIETAPDGGDNELTWSCSGLSNLNPHVQYVQIKVTTGTFQFQVGAAPGSEARSYTTTDEVPLFPIVNGRLNLHYNAASTSDVFVATLI